MRGGATEAPPPGLNQSSEMPAAFSPLDIGVITPILRGVHMEEKSHQDGDMGTGEGHFVSSKQNVAQSSLDVGCSIAQFPLNDFMGYSKTQFSQNDLESYCKA